MKSETVFPSSVLQPEYVIYAFAPAGGKRGAAPWHRIGSLIDKTTAKQQARILFGSEDCSRIEVRRRFRDPETGATRDDPVAVLHRQSIVPLRILVPTTLAFFCAALALYFTLAVGA